MQFAALHMSACGTKRQFAAALQDAFAKALAAHGVRSRPTLGVEPGRSIAAPSGLTLYTVGTVKHIPGVRSYVAVDGGMSDNLRPMLYGARYEAHAAHLPATGGLACKLVGKHCESGDVIVEDAHLPDPKVGDVIVTPATGGYGFAMSNTYNGIPRAPVVFVSGGDARVVVRRETFDDLTARDVF